MYKFQQISVNENLEEEGLLPLNSTYYFTGIRTRNYYTETNKECTHAAPLGNAYSGQTMS